MPRKRIAQLVGFVARRERTALAEIDVAVLDDRRMARLNREYLGHGGTTDVLSFDLSEPGGRGVCAQIVVCGDEARRQARRRGIGVQRELLLYVLHGLLHVLGYDDRTAADAETIRARQDELLEQFLAAAR